MKIKHIQTSISVTKEELEKGIPLHDILLRVMPADSIPFFQLAIDDSNVRVHGQVVDTLYKKIDTSELVANDQLIIHYANKHTIQVFLEREAPQKTTETSP